MNARITFTLANEELAALHRAQINSETNTGMKLGRSLIARAACLNGIEQMNGETITKSAKGVDSVKKAVKKKG